VSLYSDIMIPINFEEPFRSYSVGERAEKTWLEYPISPYTFTAFRISDYIYVRGSEASDKDLNVPVNGPYGYTFKTEVYRNDILTWSYDNYYYWEQTVPSDEATYTIKLYYKNVPAYSTNGVFEPYWSSMSTESITTIRFRSGSVQDQTQLPIINLNYDVLGMKLNNTERVLPIGGFALLIRADSMAGNPVTRVKFWQSYDDGATWTQAPVLHAGHSDLFIAGLRRPGANSYLTMKVSAVDLQGNSIEQIILRAFYVTRVQCP
jgi:hypothetical protein